MLRNGSSNFSFIVFVLAAITKHPLTCAMLLLFSLAIKVVVFVCDSLSLRKNDEEIIFQTINRAVMEKNKGFVAWLKNGRLTVGTDFLVQLLNPAQVMSFRMPPSAQGQTNIPLHSFDQRRHLEKPPERKPGYGWENENLQQQRVPFPVTIPTDNTKQNRLIGKLVLKSKLRYGSISFEQRDLKFVSEELQEIPQDIIQDLLQTNRHVRETWVKIMLIPSHNQHLVYVGDQGIEMADNDLLLLKTRVMNGLVSFDDDHVESRYPADWLVPAHILEDLNCRRPSGRLFIISDEKGNLRCHIKPEIVERVAGARNMALAFFTSFMARKESANKTKSV